MPPYERRHFVDTPKDPATSASTSGHQLVQGSNTCGPHSCLSCQLQVVPAWRKPVSSRPSSPARAPNGKLPSPSPSPQTPCSAEVGRSCREGTPHTQKPVSSCPSSPIGESLFQVVLLHLPELQMENSHRLLLLRKRLVLLKQVGHADRGRYTHKCHHRRPLY
ncbi:hypothetical protein L7F22_034006 [Adiantum nelumboides]|nr:hypothetical protein [Adiantum nelumboides]